MVAPAPRLAAQLKAKQWQVACPQCGRALQPVATAEDKPLQCSSIYALGKKDQEEMCLLFGRTYDVPVVALRYFNIYGTRQALSNPYTGVAAIFASRLLNRRAPLIFEDGEQLRDFVSVHDVVQANLLAMRAQRSRRPCPEHRLRPAGHHPADCRDLGGNPGGSHGSRDYRQVSRRRYPALFWRHHAGAAAARLQSMPPLAQRGGRACGVAALAERGGWGREGIEPISRLWPDGLKRGCRSPDGVPAEGGAEAQARS